MLLEDDSSRLKTKRELTITAYQCLFVVSFTITELLSIRLSLSRLNAPRLAVTQTFRYLGMLAAGLFVKVRHRCFRRRVVSDSDERLPWISSTTLTLIDFGVDASEKVAHMLAPSRIVEPLFGLFSIFQTLVSSACFDQPLTVLQLAGGILQTYGYFVVSTSCAGHSPETVSRGRHPMFGGAEETAGIFFGVFALILRCLSITMTEALCSSVKLTVGELCRSNGSVGLIIMAVYHLIVFSTNTEKYLILISAQEAVLLLAVFVVAAAFQQYSAFWLVLHTRAVEYARVVMFASLVLFGIRHAIYKEDGAAYGFYQVPTAGAALTILGFVLLSVVQPHAPEAQCRNGFELLENV
jgi:hypothetical protein